MIDDLCLLDTNILVYATDIDSPFYQKDKDVRDNTHRGRIKGCVALQVLTEFYSVVTNPRKNKKPLSPVQARKEIENYLKSPTIFKIFIKATTIEKMVELAEKYETKGQNVYDLQLTATMLDNGVRKIYTANEKDFVIFKEIETVNPFK